MHEKDKYIKKELRKELVGLSAASHNRSHRSVADSISCTNRGKISSSSLQQTGHRYDPANRYCLRRDSCMDRCKSLEGAWTPASKKKKTVAVRYATWGSPVEVRFVHLPVAYKRTSEIQGHLSAGMQDKAGRWAIVYFGQPKWSREAGWVQEEVRLGASYKIWRHCWFSTGLEAVVRLLAGAKQVPKNKYLATECVYIHNCAST